MQFEMELHLETEIREAYQALLSYVTEQQGLQINRRDYTKPVIHTVPEQTLEKSLGKGSMLTEPLSEHDIVAIIESDATFGEDSFTRGHGDEDPVRKQGFLELIAVNNEYVDNVLTIAKTMEPFLKGYVRVQQVYGDKADKLVTDLLPARADVRSD